MPELRDGEEGLASAPARIALVGYRGSGKSTVAGLLAQRLGWQAVDADDEVERTTGQTIAQIFGEVGEAGFRDREAEVLARLLSLSCHVSATGGGAVLRPENRARLKDAWVVWLMASPEALHARLSEDPHSPTRRPRLATGTPLEEVRSVMAAREPLYREVANLRVLTEHRTPAAIVEEILAQWPPAV